MAFTLLETSKSQHITEESYQHEGCLSSKHEVNLPNIVEGVCEYTHTQTLRMVTIIDSIDR